MTGELVSAWRSCALITVGLQKSKTPAGCRRYDRDRVSKNAEAHEEFRVAEGKVSKELGVGTAALAAVPLPG